MKKKIFYVFAFLILIVPSVILFAACGGSKEKVIDSTNAMTVQVDSKYNLTNDTITFNYGDSILFDYETEFNVYLNFTDGSNRKLAFNGTRNGFFVTNNFPELNSEGKIDAGTYTLAIKHTTIDDKDLEITKYLNVVIQKKKLVLPSLSKNSFDYSGDFVDVSSLINWNDTEKYVQISDISALRARDVSNNFIYFEIKSEYSNNYEFSGDSNVINWKINKSVIKKPTINGSLNERYEYNYGIDSETGEPKVYTLKFKLETSKDYSKMNWEFEGSLKQDFDYTDGYVLFSASSEGVYEINVECSNNFVFDDGSTTFSVKLVIVRN